MYFGFKWVRKNFIRISGCHEIPFVTIPLIIYIKYNIGINIMKHYTG